MYLPNETEDPVMYQLLGLLRAGEPEGQFRVLDADTIGAQVRGASLRFSLDQLRIWLRNSADPDALIRHNANSWLACLKPADNHLPLDRLVPVIKPVDWGQGQGDPEDPLLSVALDADYKLLIGAQLSTRLCFAARRHQLASGLAVDALMQHALDAFAEQAFAGDGICWTQFDDSPVWLAALLETPHLNASLALLPSVWDEAEQRLGGPCEVAFPDRETSLFFAAPDPELRQQVLDWVNNHRASQAYPLSPHAYRRELLWPARRMPPA